MMTRAGDDATPTPPRDPREVTRVFEGTLASVPAARRFALGHLGWVLPARRDELAVVVTELVTNAVVHVGGDIRLTLCFDQAGVRVEVRDAGEGSPRVLGSSPEDESGRGLRIVDALAEQWGVETGPGGKVVWCVLPVAGPGAGPGGR